MEENKETKEVKINVWKILVVLIIVLGAYGLFIYFREQKNGLSESDILEASFSQKCEAGEWIEFPSDKKYELPEDYNGKVIFNDSEKPVSEDGKISFAVASGYALDYFSSRTVEIQGAKSANDSQAIFVNKIRCAGEETKKETIDYRQKMMDYLAKNINDLAPEKPHKSEWGVIGFSFVDNSNLYVDYSAEDENDDNYYEEGTLLLRVNESESGFNVERLAHIIPSGGESEEDVVKEGEDIYKDREDLVDYEYDEDQGKWIMS
jgi:hypothetical protein